MKAEICISNPDTELLFSATAKSRISIIETEDGGGKISICLDGLLADNRNGDSVAFIFPLNEFNELLKNALVKWIEES